MSNSYPGRATTDLVHIAGSYASELVVIVHRVDAQGRPRGRGATLIVRRVSPGQVHGTLVVSE